MAVCCGCSVLPGRGLCDRQITRPGGDPLCVCVCVCVCVRVRARAFVLECDQVHQ